MLLNLLASVICFIMLGSSCSALKSVTMVKSVDGSIWKEPHSGIVFVRITGGCFLMGQTLEGKNQIIQSRGKTAYETHFGNEFTQHQECVDDFWIGRYEVTNAQFRKYRPDHRNESFYGHPLNQANQPVVNVNWYDVQAFANWLSGQTGKRIRLPTEPEWEYACRAGTATVRYWGDDASDACVYANTHDVTSKNQGHIQWRHHKCRDNNAAVAQVGSYLPNNFGLYDMLGNVWEWCQTIYRPENITTLDNRNLLDVWNSRGQGIIRGGSWVSGPAYVRSAARYPLPIDKGEYIVGFRLVIEPD